MRTILVGAIVVLAAMVLAPRGKRADDVSAFVDLLAAPFGRAGYFVFLGVLGITCLRAAARAASVASMLVVRLVGWDFGKPEELRETPRFALVYTVAIILAAIVPMSGVSPIELAMIVMASAAALLPLALVSFRAFASASQRAEADSHAE